MSLATSVVVSAPRDSRQLQGGIDMAARRRR